MPNKTRSKCIVIAFATTFIVASGSQNQKRAESEPPYPTLPRKLVDDSFREALQLADQKLALELDIRDALEWKLVGMRAGDPDVPHDHGTIISIVIVRSGGKEEISRAHERRVDDRWVMRFKRVVRVEIKAPVAVVSAAYVSDGRPALREKMLWADKNSVWHEWSSGAK